MSATERELRDMLRSESLDVETADRFRARLATASRRPAGPLRLVVAAAVVLAVLAIVLPAAAWDRHATPASASSGPRTAHLALRPVRHFHVTLALDLGDREALQVAHDPSDRSSLEGGEVTLFTAGAFEASTFLARSSPTSFDGHVAYAGDYPYTGVWGPVSTLAWPLPDGRWVTVQNFTGPSPAAVRAVERTVARAVLVR